MPIKDKRHAGQRRVEDPLTPLAYEVLGALRKSSRPAHLIDYYTKDQLFRRKLVVYERNASPVPHIDRRIIEWLVITQAGIFEYEQKRSQPIEHRDSEGTQSAVG